MTKNCDIITIGDTMNNLDLMNYVLIKRELEMGSKKELTEKEQILVNKIDRICELDEYIKNKIDSLMSTNNISSARKVIATKMEKELPKRQIVEEPVVLEKPKVYTLKKPININKAGFADALIMALVSGFVSGIAVTILYMMI